MFSNKRVDNLPGDLRSLLLQSGKKAGKTLTKRIRREDAKAFKLLKSRLTLVTFTSAEKAAWRSEQKKVRQKLGEGVFSAALVKKLEALAGL